MEKKTKSSFKSKKPFICGTTSAKNINAKQKNLAVCEAKKGEKIEGNIEDLNLRQMMTKDKADKLTQKIAFELLKFNLLIKKERYKSLEISISSANKSMQHFFLGTMVHFVKVYKIQA